MGLLLLLLDLEEGLERISNLLPPQGRSGWQRLLWLQWRKRKKVLGYHDYQRQQT